VGTGAIDPIIAERSKNGAFKSIEDLCRRCDLRAVNRRVMESLIKAGVMDTLGKRGTLLNSVERILSLAQREQKLRETGQTTMFDLFGDNAPVPLPQLEMSPADTTDREKAAWEKELMGVSFSEKPFSPAFSGKNPDTKFIDEIDVELDGQSVVMAGRIISARYLLTKDGRSFASSVLEDFSGQIEVMVWPKVYADTEALWKEGNEILVQGKVRVRDEQPQISCDSVRLYQPPVEEPPAPAATASKTPIPASATKAPEPAEKAGQQRSRLIINIKQTEDKDSDLARFEKIIAALKTYTGRDEVQLNVLNGGAPIPMKLPNVLTGCCPELKKQLTGLVGEGGFSIEKLD
jgi:DNA polymerase III subunit alpha